jgi:hypothetical protein
MRRLVTVSTDVSGKSDMDTDRIEHLQPAPPQGVRRFVRFGLRSLFWAMTFWAGLGRGLGGGARFNRPAGPDDLVPPRIQRRRPPAPGFVDGAPRAGHAAGSRHRPCRDTWQRIMDLAGHDSRAVGSNHFVCLFFGWHSALVAQPGTFLLVVVLNSLLWGQCLRLNTCPAILLTPYSGPSSTR